MFETILNQSPNSFFFHSIQALKPKVFHFDSTRARRKLERQTNKAKHNQIKTQAESFSDNKQQWKPKIQFKRIFEEPKFFISVERKKVRGNYEAHFSDFEQSSTQRNEFKAEKIKVKRDLTTRANRLRSTQSYFHSSLDPGSLTETLKQVRNPHFNYNLHQMIKERKKISSVCEPRKGPPASHYLLLKSNRVNRGEKLNEMFKEPFERGNAENRRTLKYLGDERNQTKIESYYFSSRELQGNL